MASGMSGRTLPWSTRSADENTPVAQRLLDERAAAGDERVPAGERPRARVHVVVGLRRRGVGHHLGPKVDEVDPRDGSVGAAVGAIELIVDSLVSRPGRLVSRPSGRVALRWYALS